MYIDCIETTIIHRQPSCALDIANHWIICGKPATLSEHDADNTYNAVLYVQEAPEPLSPDSECIIAELYLWAPSRCTQSARHLLTSENILNLRDIPELCDMSDNLTTFRNWEFVASRNSPEVDVARSKRL